MTIVGAGGCVIHRWKKQRVFHRDYGRLEIDMRDKVHGAIMGLRIPGKNALHTRNPRYDMSNNEFSLRLHAWTPKTISMKRLAEYMLPFAELLGSERLVHFKGVRKGSAALCAEVEPDGVPVVQERLVKIRQGDAPGDAVRGFNNITTLLHEDRSSAKLMHGKARIIEFPKSTVANADRIGPVREFGQLEGTVISVGGKDSTKHIRLIGQDGQTYGLSTENVELARQFGNQLFNDVRVTGEGKWFRNENGRWELDSFVIQSFEPLEDASLIEAIAALRAIEGDGWKALPDPFAACRQLRGS
jgi:hypothetical protein